MFRFVLIAGLLIGCRMHIGDDEEDQGGGVKPGSPCKMREDIQSCVDAASHSDFAWIETNIMPACAFSSCHNGASDTAGRTDLRKGQAYAHLVNFTSAIEPPRVHVVPNDVHKSYLMLMVHDFSPDMADPPTDAPANYMPKGAPALCCQKLDALEQWIMAGAPNN